MMRKVLRGAAGALAAAGVAVLAFTGVSRAADLPSGPRPPAPVPVVAPAAVVVEPDVVVEAVPMAVAEPVAAVPPEPMAAEPAAVEPVAVEPVAAVVMCAIGPDGSFQVVPDEAACPATAAVRVERASEG